MSPLFKHYLQYMSKVRRAALISFEELQQLVPERFELERLDDVFRSYLTQFQENKKAFLEYPAQGECSFIYEHDHHKYRSDAYMETYSSRFGDTNNLCIKLSNDGFFYPPEAALSIYKSGIGRHRSVTWSLLDSQHRHAFPAIVAFCKTMLRTDNILLKMYYNSLEKRFDFKSISKENRNQEVTVT